MPAVNVTREITHPIPWGQALDPPFTAMQMQRYIRFARRLNPTITPEGRRTMVECYRALRENDCVGRNKVRDKNL